MASQTINIQITIDQPKPGDSAQATNSITADSSPPTISINLTDQQQQQQQQPQQQHAQNPSPVPTAPARAFISTLQHDASAFDDPKNLAMTLGPGKSRVQFLPTTNVSSDTKAYGFDEEDAPGADPEPAGESVWLADQMSKPRRFLFVTIACLTQFCTQGSLMNTLVQLRVIGESFHVSKPGDLAWLVAGYSLTVGTFIIFSGRLGDVFGHARLTILGLAWFTVWTAVCGFSSHASFFLFVVARVCQGIGPAFSLPNALALLGSAYPPGPRKTMAFSFFGASAPCGAIISALFAGVFDKVATWPWAYYSMALVLATITLAAFLVLPRDHTTTVITLKSSFTDLDIPGAFLGIVGLVLFNFAWNQAPSVGWGSAEVLATIVIGAVMFCVFIYYELKIASSPLIPPDVILNRNVGFVLGAVLFGWGTFGIWSMYLIQIIEEIRHKSPLITSIWLIPLAPMGVLAAIMTGWFLGPLAVPAPVVMLIALVAFMTGTILTATVPTDQTYWGQIFLSVIVIPFGMDMSFPAATLIMSNSVPRKNQGVAASLVNTVVNYGVSLGVGYAGTVEVKFNHGGKTQSDMLTGFRAALYMGVILAGIGVVLCIAFLWLFIRDHDKNVENLTSGTEVETSDEREKR
ncbi:hypothetical protein TD95_003477 [Thielaviopsis punctulata]|uniref:Major facilitator superfamily (MFS) profile domain-containing protein n=1 Tax=Thielaviopsis punctulata TaxID=72032 RepID=A0A0F4ZAG4_9PEZI|nr:hypothetical protein TD95_003477 [Thielaviopsis punctulata]